MASEVEREQPWVILSRIPEVVDDTKSDGYIQSGSKDVAVGFLFKLPPRVSFLQVPNRVVPPQATSTAIYPVIAAADSSGYLLFCGSYHSTFSEHLIWLRNNSHDDDLFSPSICTGDRVASDYYICDASTGVATLIPDYPHDGSRHPGSTGLIYRGNEFIVAELRCFPEYGDKGLLRYSSKTGKWTRKTFFNSSVHINKWCNNGVIAHAKQLWWVDLLDGLLTCDPFADQPVLQHVGFPRDCDLSVNFSTTLSDLHNIFRSSCVGVSSGHLWYVQIDAERTISMWRLENLPADSQCPLDNGNDLWRLEYKVPIKDIWADDWYSAAGLQLQIIPVITLIHPYKPYIIYLLANATLFSFDLCRGKVLEWHPVNMVEVSPEYPSSELLIPWQLPPKKHSPGALAQLRSWMPEVLKPFKNKFSQLLRFIM